MTNDAGELLRCPFCAAELIGNAIHGKRHPNNECVLFGQFIYFADAEKWNRRAATAADGALPERTIELPVDPGRMQPVDCSQLRDQGLMHYPDDYNEVWQYADALRAKAVSAIASSGDYGMLRDKYDALKLERDAAIAKAEQAVRDAELAKSNERARFEKLCKETAAHMKENAQSLREFPGHEDEARARELAAVYVEEMVLSLMLDDDITGIDAAIAAAAGRVE